MIDRFVRASSGVACAMVMVTVAVAAVPAAKPAPTATFHLADGSTTRPDTYKGQVLLVDFWASWCVPCKASFPALDGLYKEFRDRGFQVIAVNVDERDRDAQAFLAPRPHVMPIAFDPKGEVAKQFDVKAMPTSVFIDRAGNVRLVHTGYATKDLESYRDEITNLLKEP